jgi:hypothetical protein
MFRSIIAVIISYVLWSVLWVAYNPLLKALGVLPTGDTTPITDAIPLAALLLGSFVFSLVAGYVVAVLKKSVSIIPVAALGVLLLATGIFVELQYWQLMPVWYHLLFLAALIPLCFFGSRLRQPKSSSSGKQ